MVSGGVEGVEVAVERPTVPLNSFRLVSVIVARPVKPEANAIFVGLMEKLKSTTATVIMTVLTSVSGLPAGSIVE